MIGVEEDGHFLGGRSYSVGAVLEDGGDRFVRAGVEQKTVFWVMRASTS